MLRRGRTRLVSVCVALFGLFLMHGVPAALAAGCHGVFAGASVPGGHGAAMPPTQAVMPPHAGQITRTVEPGQTFGSLCVSTPARDQAHLPPAGVVTVAAATAHATCCQTGLQAVGGMRGPPTAGRDLLNRVCITRM